jgi:GT2 family glycosyltransferase
LESLVATLKNMTARHPFQIVVVEETDKPEPIPGSLYIPHPVTNRGIPYARNLALQNADGEIVVFLDDDCSIQDGWLDKLLEPFEDHLVLGVQGGVTVPESAGAIGWSESILGFPGGGISRVLKAKGKNHETEVISTLNCAYRKWVVDRVGGFDERLKVGGEDFLFAQRVRKFGRLLFVPGALVRHAERGKLSSIWRWFVRRGRAEITLMLVEALDHDYMKYILRASLSLKILATVLLSLWFGFVPLTLLLCFYAVFACWKARWALHQSGIPFLAWLVLPLVKCTMDLASDTGRFLQLCLISSTTSKT